MQIAAYCMELNLPPEWAAQEGAEDPQCQLHVCGAFQSAAPAQGAQAQPLLRAAVALKMTKYSWI